MSSVPVDVSLLVHRVKRDKRRSGLTRRSPTRLDAAGGGVTARSAWRAFGERCVVAVPWRERATPGNLGVWIKAPGATPRSDL